MTASQTFSPAELLAPITVAEFFANYWEQRPLRVERNQPGFYDAILSVEALDRHLLSRQLPACFINVVRDAQPVAMDQWTRVPSSAEKKCPPPWLAVPEALWREYLAGATLIFNATDDCLPTLMEFFGTLSREWCLDVQTNL